MRCCLKICPVECVLDGRIEVKAVVPEVFVNSDKFLVAWKSNGEAEFHRDCWDKVIQYSRCRRKDGMDGVSMTKEEKAMVKTAEDAVEEYDSLESLKSEAKRAADWIREAKHLVTFTGAGISTSAGIGDYRGKAGKWTEEDQSLLKMDMANNSTSSESACEGEPVPKKAKLDSSLKTEKEEEWDEDDEEEGLEYEKLRPTYTHEALYKLVQSGYLKYIISQNCDGLHCLSGVEADKVAELHGNVFVEKCEKCEERYDRKFYVMDDTGSQYYEEMEDNGKSSVKKPKFASKCELCGLSHRTGRNCKKGKCRGHLMDTIINFRDMLDEEILTDATEMAEQCDVMLCLGTTLRVTPAADLVRKMKNKNRLIICNRQGTPLDKQFTKQTSDGERRGARVFGDCDVFMREVMQHLYSKEDLKDWESKRQDTLKLYDKQRD